MVRVNSNDIACEFQAVCYVTIGVTASITVLEKRWEKPGTRATHLAQGHPCLGHRNLRLDAAAEFLPSALQPPATKVTGHLCHDYADPGGGRSRNVLTLKCGQAQKDDKPASAQKRTPDKRLGHPQAYNDRL